MITQCCVCRKIRKGKAWVRCSEQTLARAEVSHGYCASCAENAFAEFWSITPKSTTAPGN